MTLKALRSAAVLAACVALLLSGSSLYSQAGCEPPSLGIVSSWPGEGNANDTVDSNPGTLVNGVAFQPGVVGQAFSFDGFDDYVNVPPADSIFFGNSEPFTVEGWFKAESETPSYFILKNAGYGIRWQGSSSPMRFYNGNNHSSAKSTWELGRWYHVALVDDGVNSVKLYLDGVLDKSDDGVLRNPNRFPCHPSGAYCFPLQFGGVWETHDVSYFQGEVDEVTLYSRALAEAEIQAIFDAGSAGKCILPPAGAGPCPIPVSWWPGEGNADDIIGVNSGTLVNGVSFAPGMVGHAFSFDGTGEVVIPHDASLNFQTLTIEAWVHPTVIDGHIDIIVNKEINSSSLLEYEIGIRGTDSPGEGSIPVGNVAFFLGGIGGIPREFAGWADGGGSAPLNRWTHVALTFNGNAVAFYIDGQVSRTLNNLSGSLTTSSGSFKIGSRSDVANALNPHERFTGLIDEVRIFDRALTPAEIADFDGDLVRDLCDNCLTSPNPSQSDQDLDGEGDACDLDDGFILLDLPDPGSVSYQLESGFSTFNIYRGEMAFLRATNVYTQNFTQAFCGEVSGLLLDGFVPGLGQVVFYLAEGAGGDLGSDSDGNIRPNDNPCP